MKEQFPTLESNHGLTLENAVLLAEAAHEGQADKADGPYIFHPVRVMQALEPYGETVQMAGILHDVIENTSIALDDLRKLGTPEEIVEAVDSLSIRDGEEYNDAIARVKNNKIGRLVKVADNRDNANKKRKALLPEAEQAKSEAKYAKALEQLVDGDEWLAAQAPLIQVRIETLYDAA